MCCRSQWPNGLNRGSGIGGFEYRRGHRVCECYMLSSRGLCDGLVTRPKESYRLLCVWVWSGSLDNEEETPCRAMKKKMYEPSVSLHSTNLKQSYYFARSCRKFACLTIYLTYILTLTLTQKQTEDSHVIASVSVFETQTCLHQIFCSAAP